MRNGTLFFAVSLLATALCVVAMNAPSTAQVVLRAYPNKGRKEIRHAVLFDETEWQKELERESKAHVAVVQEQHQKINDFMKKFNYYVVTHAKASKIPWTATDREPECFWTVEDMVIKRLVASDEKKLFFNKIAYSPTNPFRLTITLKTYLEKDGSEETRKPGLLKLNCPTLANSAELLALLFSMGSSEWMEKNAEWMEKNVLELDPTKGDMFIRLAADYSLDHREEVIPVLNLHSVMKSFLEEANVKLESTPWMITADKHFARIESPPKEFIFSDATATKTKIAGHFLFESAKDALMNANNIIFHLGSHTFPFHPKSEIFKGIRRAISGRRPAFNAKEEPLKKWLQTVQKKGLLTVMPGDVTILPNFKPVEEPKDRGPSTLLGIVLQPLPAKSYFVASGLDWIAFPELKIHANAPELPEVVMRSPFYIISETTHRCQRTALSKCTFLDVEFTIPFNEAL